MDFGKPIFKKFTTISQLPSLPGVLLKLIQTCNRDTSSMSDVSGIIETDPSLSSRILRLVNSAQYSIPHRVESMRQAVNLIGMSTIKNLALCASVHEVFRSTRKDSAFDLKAFWGHSLLCGLLAKRLAESCGYEKPEEAFLCGLFHDIGKLVLWTCFGDTYAQHLSDDQNRDSLLNAELRLGVTHPEAGAWLLHHWGLPTLMSDPILYHHEPRKRIMSAFTLVKLVYCAHHLCTAGADRPVDEVDFQPAIDILGVTASDARNALERADRELVEVANLLQIKVKAPGQQAEEAGGPGMERVKLTREVRDMSLLRGTLESLLTARDQPGIIRVLLEGIQILFDRTRVLVFLLDDEQKALLCAHPSQDEVPFSTGNNAIPLEQSRSLIVRCLEENRPTNSHEGEESFPPERPIMDDQIIRHLGKEGVYCVPMRASGVNVGVLVLAMDSHEQAFFAQQENVFSLFAQQAGLALLTERLKRKNFDEIQRERLNAVYTFSRKISHEVKSPLSIIKNYLHILGLKISDQSIAREEIRIIHEEIDRISSILEKLSNLSPENEFQNNERIDVNSMIKDLAKIMEESLSRNSNVGLHMDLQEKLPSVIASRDAIKQVLINLIRNGVEAMKQGGDLTIKTRKSKLYDPDGNNLVENTGSDAVEISIADNGDGIPEALRSRLFEPFVGTKKDEHSGLGLSIVHSLVNSCGGRVTCMNNPGGGSTFKVAFPAERNCG